MRRCHGRGLKKLFGNIDDADRQHLTEGMWYVDVGGLTRRLRWRPSIINKEAYEIITSWLTNEGLLDLPRLLSLGHISNNEKQKHIGSRDE